MKSTDPRNVGKYVGLSVLLPVSTLIGYGMGYGLDYMFGTHWLRFVFMVFGIAAGFIELLKELGDGS